MKDQSFLGKGWSFPISFLNGGRDLVMSGGEDNIAESLEILITTEHLERLMRPYFGCSMRQFVYEELTQGLISRIKDEISNAMLSGEPRIDLLKVNVNKARDHDGVLLIDIEYMIRSTNTRSNKVYPFYLRELSLKDGY